MHRPPTPTFSVSLGLYDLKFDLEHYARLRSIYVKRGAFVDEFDLTEDAQPCSVVVTRPGGGEILVVAVPIIWVGINGISALFVPETHVLFLAAYERLLAYDLKQPARLWEDHTPAGCFGWQQHGDHALMAGELELAAWTTDGRTEWRADVDPPWTYHVEEDTVHLTVEHFATMTFPLATGPQWGGVLPWTRREAPGAGATS